MNRANNKADRFQAITALLFTHPEGMTRTEIAHRLGVDRTTITRNVADIDAPVYEEHGRLHLDRKSDLLYLHLSLHEALSVHLAARLLATNLDRQNAHAATALRKISRALEQLSPQISRHVERSAETIDERASYDGPAYMHVLETLTEGWARGCKVRIWHRKAPGEAPSCQVLLPYYIEPGAWGRSTYVIGQRELDGEMRTFKIERIEQAELIEEHYTIPDDFDPFQLLADAWGIWYTEEEPVEVALKFSPRVRGRVLETHWHRSQHLEEQPDGSLIWRAKVAAVQEMLPWIRGWGADVEVLEPAGLREEMKDTMRAAAERYGWKVIEDETNTQ